MFYVGDPRMKIGDGGLEGLDGLADHLSHEAERTVLGALYRVWHG